MPQSMADLSLKVHFTLHCYKVMVLLTHPFFRFIFDISIPGFASVSEVLQPWNHPASNGKEQHQNPPLHERDVSNSGPVSIVVMYSNRAGLGGGGGGGLLFTAKFPLEKETRTAGTLNLSLTAAG